MGASVRAALAEHHLDGAGCTELDDRFDFDDLGIEKVRAYLCILGG